MRWASWSRNSCSSQPSATLRLSTSPTGTPPTYSPLAEFAQLVWCFTICLFGFRWALADQRQRCPVCLRRVTHPARVGLASRTFLGWNGTEMMCMGGHTLLHVPSLPDKLVQRPALALPRHVVGIPLCRLGRVVSCRKIQQRTCHKTPVPHPFGVFCRKGGKPRKQIGRLHNEPTRESALK